MFKKIKEEWDKNPTPTWSDVMWILAFDAFVVASLYYSF
jgi:hypothetical protein